MADTTMSGGLGSGAARGQQEEDNLVSNAVAVGPAPAGLSAPRRPVVPRTKFAEAYRSIFTLTPPGDEFLEQFAHLNCNYLSTKGHAPTLLELKQHTQALIILLKQIAISTSAGVADHTGSGEAGPRFNANEAFDFLNDLNTVYENNTVHHNLPLVSLLNTLEKPQYPQGLTVNPSSTADELTEIDICPLHPVQPAPLNGPSLPYATHQALLQHANEVLELIDHEYSAKGGLLGVLPHEKDQDRPLAETTLLGQMILYIQRLVARLHTLERIHANAMDVMKGEAVVPVQALSRVGPDGRSGREIVYPQDRFVLVNAGDDVWGFLNDSFEKKERTDEEVRLNYLRLGLEGEKLWEQRGGHEYARGITYMDITTRYYRLRGDGLKTVFVIPAYAEHPGTKVTREMEQQPTVVSVVKPVWPERVSVWEKKVRDDMEELRQLRLGASDLHTKVDELTNERTYLLREVNNFRALAFKARQDLRTLEESDPELHQEATRLNVQRAEQQAKEEALAQREAAIRGREEELQTQRDEILRAQGEQVRQQQRSVDELARERERFERTSKVKLDALERERLLAQQRGEEVADAFQEAWEEHVRETAVLIEWLGREEVREKLAGEQIPKNVADRGVKRAQEVIDRVLERLRRPL